MPYDNVFQASWCIRELLQGLEKTHFWLLVPEMLLQLDLGREWWVAPELALPTVSHAKLML